VCRFLSAIILSFPRERGAFSSFTNQSKESPASIQLGSANDVRYSFEWDLDQQHLGQLDPTTFARYQMGKSGLQLRITDQSYRSPPLGFHLHLSGTEGDTFPEVFGDTGASRAMAWLRQRLAECDISVEYGDRQHQSIAQPSVFLLESWKSPAIIK
jgi:hypothetical protein